ncbi:hypothetical protein Tco_0323350 [Tanacetum coccineum]
MLRPRILAFCQLFLHIDSTAFTLFVSLKSKILSKDPPSKIYKYDTEACDFLRTHTAPFWKFPEPFLCWIGISRYYTLDENCYTMFWDGEDEMDLFAFICHSDPTKVRIGERNLAEREVRLLKMTEGRTVPLDPRVTAASGDSGDSIDKLFVEGNDAVLTSPCEVCCIFCGMVLEGSGIPSGVTKPLLGASMAPMPDVGPVDSVSGLNLRTRPPHVRSLVADASIVTVVVTTTVVADVSAISCSTARDESKNLENVKDFASAGGANADAASILKWKVKNDSILEDQYVCRDLTERLAPRALFAQLRAIDYDQLYSEFNVGASRQRDVEIAHLKSLLSLKEIEAAEAIRCRGQLTTLEDADATKDSELKDLKERNFALVEERDVMSEKIATLESANAAKEAELASLSSEVAKLTSDLFAFQLSHDDLKSSLESTFELFSACIEATQDEQIRVLGTRVAELDAQLLEMAAHLDEEFYPCFLTAISGRRWILTHGLKLVILKCLQSLEYCHALGTAIGCAVNKAYDLSAEAKYIEVVNALGAVDFSLLSEIKYKNDASIMDLMDSLRLEGPLADIPGAEDLQPSLEQLRLPMHRLGENVVLGETSLSFSLQVPLSSRSLIGEASNSATPATTESITTLSTTLATSDVIPPLVTFNDQALDTKLNNEDPPVVTFDKEELVTSPE